MPTITIPSKDDLVAMIAADPEVGMPIDWSSQEPDPQTIYYEIVEDEYRQLGTYASWRAAELAIAEQIYARGEGLQERYALEPQTTRMGVAREYDQNIPAFLAEFEIRPVSGLSILR